MFLCFICKNQYQTVRILLRHLKFSHCFYPNTRVQLVCSQNGCCQRFSTFSGFRKHLLKKHSESAGDESPTHSLSVCTLPQAVPDQHESSHYTAGHSERSNEKDIKPNTTEMCASIIGGLLSADVATTKVKSFVEKIEKFVDASHANVRDDILK